MQFSLELLLNAPASTVDTNPMGWGRDYGPKEAEQEYFDFIDNGYTDEDVEEIDVPCWLLARCHFAQEDWYRVWG